MTEKAHDNVLIIETGRSEDLERMLALDALVFGISPSRETYERFRTLLEPHRTLNTSVEGRMVGAAGAFAFDLTIPGGELPVAGVTLVGVAPTHRRRGILTALMQQQLKDIHQWGESVAVLWASECGIYGRFGYGVATWRAAIEIDRDRSSFRASSVRTGQVRLLDLEEALTVLPPVYEQLRRREPGLFARSNDWWRNHRLPTTTWAGESLPAIQHAILEINGVVEGYALYRIHRGWKDGGLPDYRVEVLEVLASSPLATRQLWEYLFGIDLVTRVEAPRLAPDHPLALMLAEPRQLRMRVMDGLWLRLVDLRAALTARCYAIEGTVTLEVTDALCTWNAGRWKLTASTSGGQVEATSDTADLRLDIADLGSTYLGGVSFGSLARAGRLIECRPGAAHLADSLFQTPTAPWCPEEF